MKHLIWILLVLATALPSGPARAADSVGTTDMEAVGTAVVNAAKKALGPNTIQACLTNAQWARLENRPCHPLFDLFSRQAGVSLGNDSLLPLHGRWGEAPWAAFISRPGPDRLLMVLVRITSQGSDISGPLNVRVKGPTDFSSFEQAFGRQAFALVTLANGWADRFPHEILAGGLFHDHLCCGVFTGYFTARYILDRFPLSKGQAYTYLGVPSWCQDDLIISALNLTPGKGGYVTMAYPWNRPWKTGAATYENLGGIVVRRDGRTGGGQAWVLSFDWRFPEFRQYAGLREGPLDWKNQPWLHVAYNRFLAGRLDRPRDFVSVVKTARLETASEIQDLVRLGANPLEILLGPDTSWPGQKD